MQLLRQETDPGTDSNTVNRDRENTRPHRKTSTLLSITVAVGACILFVLTLAPTLMASVASSEEMELVCRNWLSQVVYDKGDWAGETNPDILKAEELVQDGQILGHCFAIAPTGYVMVPVLKELPSIKAYSTESNLNVSDTGGFTQLLKDVLTDRLRLYEDIYGSIEAAQPATGEVLLGRGNRERWDRYAVSTEEFDKFLNKSGRSPMDVVGPLMTTIWDQGSPYNDYCPMGDGGRCVAGCVATAYAQIMAYHQWPPSGDSSHTYYWSGDGPVPGRYLTADFSDPYDWEHIINACFSGCEPEDSAALAELNYEVGVACEMNYGADGSGAWPSIMLAHMPTYFGYSWDITEIFRNDYNAASWFDIVRDQIDQDMPIHYVIHSHAIVCDGYDNSGGSMQYHMNYGWGGNNNSWFTVDSVYCPWDGCNPLVEHMLINIYPDKAVLFDADSTLGWAPFAVSFVGSSDLTVDTWTWDFGDGDSAWVQSPDHIYSLPGACDVTLRIDAGGNIRSLTKVDYITALADSMIADDVDAAAGATAEVTIYARNTVPVNRIWVPVMYDQGDLVLSYDSFSTEGCRTDYFEQQALIQYSPNSRKATFALRSSTSGSVSDLEPGAGPILKVYFEVSGTAQPGQSTAIGLDQNTSYPPMFFTEEFDYETRTVAGSVSCPDTESVAISLDAVTGLIDDTTISALREVRFYLRLTNNDSSDFKAVTNGFRVYSPDGATWSTTIPDTLGSIDWTSNFGFFFPVETNVDGVGADTVGFSGVGAGIPPEVGIPGAFDDTAFSITIGPVDSIYTGRTICLDSCWYPPSGVWKWDGGAGVGYRYPAWDGPHCFTVGYDACCMPPIRGNIDYDPGDAIDIGDLVYLIDFMFTDGPAPECMEETDINGSGVGSPVDISDLVHLVDYMFNGGPEPAACP